LNWIKSSQHPARLGLLLIFSTIIMSFLISACSRITLPPLASPPTDIYHTGKFVWIDLLTDDVQKSKDFYGDLFGWKYEALDENDTYTLIRVGERYIGGIFYSDRLEDESESRWITYLSVPDVDQATRLAVQRGGEVQMKPVNYPDRGRFSIVSDPQGVIVAFLHSSSGDLQARELEFNVWMWNELWTTDIEGAFDFYHEIAGYEKEAYGAGQGQSYYLMKREGRYRAGMVQLPWKGVEPNWIPYVLVDNPAGVASKAEDLGGKVLLYPKSVVHNGSAILADPSGAIFAVQVHPSRENEEVN